MWGPLSSRGKLVVKLMKDGKACRFKKGRMPYLFPFLLYFVFFQDIFSCTCLVNQLSTRIAERCVPGMQFCFKVP